MHCAKNLALMLKDHYVLVITFPEMNEEHVQNDHLLRHNSSTVFKKNLMVFIGTSRDLLHYVCKTCKVHA